MHHRTRRLRLLTKSCMRCCGALCQGRKRVAQGFVPSVAVLIEKNRVEETLELVRVI